MIGTVRLQPDRGIQNHVTSTKRAQILTYPSTVAKAALRRKKAFEHQLEQTSAQMMTVEREIGSIESANINKETLDAMRNASKAIQNIHGGLTVDQVDQTMEDLREQHAVGEEIAEALTQGAQTSGVDEDELDEELAELQQEALDERMLKTGSVPVHDQIQRMPNAPSKFLELKGRLRERKTSNADTLHSKEHSHGRRRRRGGRATEAAGRDGHVRWRWRSEMCHPASSYPSVNPCETEFCIHAWGAFVVDFLYTLRGVYLLLCQVGLFVFAVLASVPLSLESKQELGFFLLHSYPCSHELQTTVDFHCNFGEIVSTSRSPEFHIPSTSCNFWKSSNPISPFPQAIAISHTSSPKSPCSTKSQNKQNLVLMLHFRHLMHAKYSPDPSLVFQKGRIPSLL